MLPCRITLLSSSSLLLNTLKVCKGVFIFLIACLYNVSLHFIKNTLKLKMKFQRERKRILKQSDIAIDKFLLTAEINNVLLKL